MDSSPASPNLKPKLYVRKKLKLNVKKLFKLAAVATCCYISYKSPLGMSATILLGGIYTALKVPEFFGMSLISMPVFMAVVAATLAFTPQPLVCGPDFPERKIHYNEARSKAFRDLCQEIAANPTARFPQTNSFNFSRGLAHTLSWSMNYNNFVGTHTLVVNPASNGNTNMVQVVEHNALGRPISTNNAMVVRLSLN